MNLKEIMLIRQFAKSQPYNREQFNINNIFKFYSSFAIKSLEDFSKISKEFGQVLDSLQDCMVFENKYDKEDFERDARRFPFLLKKEFEPTSALIDDEYTLAVKELAPCKEQTKLLEVGSGQVPHSSIIFSKSMDNVSSLDNFLLSQTALSNIGITGIDGRFDSKTQVSQYDFVVGQRPCSAIENMVINASRENKPYFIELCSCNLDSIARRDGIYRNWQQILPEYDSHVKFVGEYAFNVDATEQQVSNLLYQIRSEQLAKAEEILVDDNTPVVSENLLDDSCCQN